MSVIKTVLVNEEEVKQQFRDMMSPAKGTFYTNFVGILEEKMQVLGEMAGADKVCCKVGDNIATYYIFVGETVFIFNSSHTSSITKHDAVNISLDF